MLPDLVEVEGLLPTEARLAGPLLAAQKIDLRRPRDRPVRLVSSDSGRLQGHLRAPAGTAVGDRRVCARMGQARMGQGETSRCVDTAGDGAFSFGALAPGRYLIEVRSSRAWNGGPSPHAEATVPVGATAELDLEVPADDGVLAGRVVDAAAPPSRMRW